MAQRLRIFLSSPGDVDAERLRAHLIIQKLARDYARFFQIEPYLWEYEPMLASGHFQDMIEPPSKADIVVLVVWSRLGTPLPERTAVREYRGLDGHVPITGTEWEFESALSARQATGAPDLLAYRRAEVPRTTMGDTAVRDRELQQYNALEAFWHRYFEDRGVFLAASMRYATIEEFDHRLESDLKKLLERRIERGIGGATATSGAVWLKGSPFRSLMAYQFADASIFFGRDGAIRATLSRLAEAAERHTAFLLIAGASGSGKSSLARAGLLPALAAPLAVKNVGFWRRAIMHPGDAGDDPFLGLARALADKTGNDQGVAELLGPGMQVNELAQHLRASAAEPAYLFKKAMAEIAAAEREKRGLLPHEEVRLVLLVDQFEELFTRSGIASTDRALFIRLLAGLARSDVVWVIATIRSDLRHLATESKELVALVEAGAQVDLAAPDDAELLEIIRQPAAAAGLTFDTDPETNLGLDGILVKAAAAEPGALPLLSVVLDTLYERDVAAHGTDAAPARTLTVATYRALGELKGAIAQRAEETYRRLAEQDAPAAAALGDVLRAVVTTNDGTTVTARAAALEDFPAGSPGRRLIETFLAPDSRLLVAEVGAHGPEVRLAHEILLSEWPRAQKHVADDRRDIETRSRLENLLHRYLRADARERKAAMLDGLSLAEGVDLVARWKIAAAAPLAAFVAASAAAARWRRQRLLAAAIVLMTVFAGVAAAATWQWQVARTERQAARTSAAAASRSAGLAKLSAAQAQENARRATAEASRADAELRRRQVEEADRVAFMANLLNDEERGALAGAVALQAAPRLQDGGDRPLPASLVGALARSLRMDHELLRRVVDGNNMLRLAMTKDERTLVTGLNTGAIQFWDLPGLVLRKNVKAQKDYVTSLDIAPDQNSVLVAGDKVPSVWDLHTGEKRFDLAVPNPVKFAKMARYSPDGSVIAAGGADNRVLVFDAKTGRLLHELPGPNFDDAYKRAEERGQQQGGGFGVADPIVAAVAKANFTIFGATTEIAFSPDSKTLAVTGPGDPEAAVRLFDVATGALRTTLIGTELNPMGAPMNYGDLLQFSASGTRLAEVAPSGNIQVFDTAKGTLLRVLTTFQTNSILLTPDGELLISGHQDGSLAFWCVSNGQLIATPRNHRAGIEHLDFNSSHTLFVSTADDATAAEWAVPRPSDVCSVNGHRFGENWLKSMKPVATFEGHRSNVNRAAFLDRDRELVTVSRDGTLRLWTMAERGTTALLADAGDDAGTWGYRLASHLTFAPDGGDLVVNGIASEKAALWRVETGTLLAPLEADRVAAGRPDHTIAAQPTPFTGTVFDSRSGSVVSHLGPKETDSFVATPDDWSWEIAPDGGHAIGVRAWLKYFNAINAKGSADDDHDAGNEPDGQDAPRIVMDTATGKEMFELTVDGFRVDRAAFSADSRLVVALMIKGKRFDFNNNPERMVAVWDVDGGKLLGHTPPTKNDFDFDYSADGRTLMLLPKSNNQAEQHRLDGDVLYRLGPAGLAPVKLVVARGESQTVTAASVAPGGAFLVGGLADGSLVAWNAATGTVAAELNASQSPILKVAMSPDGQFIAAADDARTIRVVDRRTGAITAAPTLTDSVNEMQFAPQGNRLAVLIAGGTTYVIDISPPPSELKGDALALIDWARASKEHDISAAARRRYGVDPPPPLERPDLGAIKPFAVTPPLPRPSRPAELAQCDTLAADPEDRDATAHGIAFAAVVADRAVPACLAALAKAPDDLRSLYQYGRALARAGRLPEAMTYYKHAADGGYAAAMRAIAEARERDNSGEFAALGEAQRWYERAAAAGDSAALLTVAARQAGSADDAASVQRALSMALAAGWNRLSAAAMSVGQRIDNGSGGDAAQKKRALFYVELGRWLADNVNQSGALRDDERALRNNIGSRLDTLTTAMTPQDVVAVYRAARDWHPKIPGSAAASP